MVMLLVYILQPVPHPHIPCHGLLRWHYIEQSQPAKPPMWYRQLCKIWSACKQYELQHAELGMNKYRPVQNHAYNFVYFSVCNVQKKY